MQCQTPLSQERERQLIARIQSGDRDPLGELLGAYQNRVYHICLRMVRHTDDAADLTQETLLRAVKHIDGFRSGSRFSTWILRIAMNLSVSHLRKGKVRSGVSLDAPAGGGWGGGTPGSLRDFLPAGGELSPPLSVERNEQTRLLTAAIDTLDPALRAVLLLRDLQGLDYQEAAEVLAVPVGTVKSRLFRARVALRQAMEASVGPAGAAKSNGQPAPKPMK